MAKTADCYYTACFAAVQPFFAIPHEKACIYRQAGTVNNHEGEMFVPPGIRLLLAMTAADVPIIVKTVSSGSMTRCEKVLTVLSFIAVRGRFSEMPRGSADR